MFDRDWMTVDVKEYLRSKAKAHPKKVVFPETGEERILRAARRVAGYWDCLPHPGRQAGDYHRICSSLGVSLEGIAIADNTDEALVDGYVARYWQINATLRPQDSSSA